MSAPLAIVQALLTPNLRRGLPFVIMLLMLQGIHPEIIFNLIPYVAISRQQHEAVMMAWTQLRLFASLLPGVRGFKPKSYQAQRRTFKSFPQDRVSVIFGKFQNSVLSRMLAMLAQFGFVGTLPSLHVLKNLATNLTVVRTVHSNMFPIASLFVVSNQKLVLMKTALQMQGMIEHVRFFYPDILSFLVQNENALKNFFMVWNNQVVVKDIIYSYFYDILEPVKMNDLFVWCILAVINPDFIDESLAEVVKNCGYPSGPFQNIQEHLQFLKDHCKSVEPMIFGHFLDIGKVLACFSSMVTSTTRFFQVRYALRPWSMALGRIDPSNLPEFEKVTIEQGSSVPIFDVFSQFWQAFFLNFSRTFAVSFLPFGNLPWSEGYTRLIQTEFDWIIRIVVGNFAFRIGALDDHAFFKRKTPEYRHSDITSTSYEMFIFPDGIRNSRISSEICSCFLRDFWIAHRKPDPIMSDIDYIRWLFSIPGTFAVFGESWIELVDALQNGTELPRSRDGSSGDFNYLSFPTDPTDPEVELDYDIIFREYFRQLGREPKISDFFDESKK